MSRSHEKADRLVHDLRETASEIHNARNQRQHYRSQFERHKQHVAQAHDKIRQHNSLSPDRKAHPNWSKHLHELHLKLDQEQRNQNIAAERQSNTQAHVSRLVTRFNGQKAHVYTEYNQVLRMNVPDNVKQFIHRVQNPQWS